MLPLPHQVLLFHNHLDHAAFLAAEIHQKQMDLVLDWGSGMDLVIVLPLLLDLVMGLGLVMALEKVKDLVMVMALERVMD